MQSRTTYGIIALLGAALVFSSSATLYYYYQYNQVKDSNTNLTNELQNAAQKYNSTAFQFNQLATNYNQLLSRFNVLGANFNGSKAYFDQMASVYNESVVQFNLLSINFVSLSSQYNTTFSLLGDALSHINTSEPTYTIASTMLAGLWRQYGSIVSSYKTISQNYSQIFERFSAIMISFSHDANTTKTMTNYPEPIKPISSALLASNILFDFGNGTRVWFNDTSIQPNWNLYLATLVVTSGNMQATWYPAYSEHFVTGIFGTNDTSKKTWFEWSYNASSSNWFSPAAGADQIMMYNGSAYAWTFCGFNATTYMPSCQPP